MLLSIIQPSVGMLLFVCAVVLCVITLLPYSRHPAWWVRCWEFPRLQIATLAIVAASLQLGLFAFDTWASWFVVVASGAVALIQGWRILPYTRVYPVQAKRAASSAKGLQIRIMVANVLTPNRNAADLLAQVRAQQPDILVTMESDIWWQQQLSSLEADYPHRLYQPQDNLYGMHVYSKLPWKQAKIAFLVEDDVPSMHFILRLNDSADMRLHVLHPAPPSPTENASSKPRDAELIQVAKYAQQQQQQHNLPVMVVGDLNDVAWSDSTRLFKKLSGLLDPRVGRGMFNTFHAKYWPLRWPLDHMFYSDHFQLVHMQRLPKFGSDHFPMLLELAFLPSQQHTQEGLMAKAEDHAWAEDTLESSDSP